MKRAAFLASLVKRSVIKTRGQGEREREKCGSIDADSGGSVFIPPSIDMFSQLCRERRRRM